MNSTVGVFGLMDPASVIGLTKVTADFGQTLYIWGVSEGSYVELPLFGSVNRTGCGWDGG